MRGGRAMLAPTASAVLISIRPEWCGKIVTGEKAFEVRKTKPKLEPPFKCYIYCTYGRGLIERFDSIYPNVLLDQKVSASKTFGNCCNGKVIAEFVCDEIRDCRDLHLEDVAMSVEQWLDYTNGHKGPTYGWHISHLKVYTKPKDLCEFKARRRSGNWSYVERIKRAPQSWCYVEDAANG